MEEDIDQIEEEEMPPATDPEDEVEEEDGMEEGVDADEEYGVEDAKAAGAVAEQAAANGHIVEADGPADNVATEEQVAQTANEVDSAEAAAEDGSADEQALQTAADVETNATATDEAVAAEADSAEAVAANEETPEITPEVDADATVLDEDAAGEEADEPSASTPPAPVTETSTTEPEAAAAQEQAAESSQQTEAPVTQTAEPVPTVSSLLAPVTSAAATAASSAFPKGLAGGLPPKGLSGGLPPKGLTGGLPPRRVSSDTAAASASEPAQQASSTAATAPATSPATAAPSTSTTASAPAPSAPSAPAGLPRLPPRGLGGAALGAPAGLGAALPRPPVSAPQAPPASASSSAPSAAPSTAAPAQPAAPAPAAAASAAPARPMLPPRPAPSAASASAGSSGPALPPRPGMPSGMFGAPPPGLGGSGIRPGMAPRPPGAPAAAAAGPASVAPAAQPDANETVDRRETKPVQRLQSDLMDLRVQLIRAVRRLGLSYEAPNVQQWLTMMDRQETVLGQRIYKHTRRADLNAAAAREARRLDDADPNGKIKLRLKIMLIGPAGGGKTALINSLFGRPERPTRATGRVHAVRGTHNGIPITFIDTPGLVISASHHTENRAKLMAMKSAYKWHKPDFVFYVDRLDAVRPGLAEVPVMALANEVLGAEIWAKSYVVLTHAHMARMVYGAQYETVQMNRKRVLQQMIRQVAQSQQVRAIGVLVDNHPSCIRNSAQQPVVLDGGATLPWQQQMVSILTAQYCVTEFGLKLQAATPKTKEAAKARSQQDLMKAMMRPRPAIPKVSNWLAQMVEGIIKPPGYPGYVYDNVQIWYEPPSDDEAEEFNHMYYQLIYQAARNGDPLAQKEYAEMMRDVAGGFKAVQQDDEDLQQDEVQNMGVESITTDPLDLGQTFEPENKYSYRFVTAVADTDIQCIPALEYYGPEHDTAVNGVVITWATQAGNKLGWGGVPLEVTTAVESEKGNLALQGDIKASLVHTLPPFGGRHVTQVRGTYEILRPRLSDVLYQLEVNTVKEDLLWHGSHAGAGLLWSRFGENGDPRKGPQAFGLRLQESFRVGPFKIESCAAKCAVDNQRGGKDEGYQARFFIDYDWLPGVATTLDFFAKKPLPGKRQRFALWAANCSWDFELAGAACGIEVDHVLSSDVAHVALNVFNGFDYRWGWLLLIPAWNWLKDKWRQWRSGGQGEEMMMMDAEEGDADQEEGMQALQAMLGGRIPGMNMGM